MIDINTYIQEKLHISKDYKCMDKEDTINAMLKIVKELVSGHNYSYGYVTESKTVTEDINKTWYVNVDVHNIEPYKAIKLYKDLKEQLKEIIPEENIKYYNVFSWYDYKLFLYEPED